MTETWRRWMSAVTVMIAAVATAAPALAQTPAPADQKPPDQKAEEKGPQTLWDALFPPPPTAPGPALADKDEKKEEKPPPTLWEEIKLFAYIENSWTFNLTGAGRDATNELRLYDFDEGWTFNMAESSIKKDPTERNWWGMGLVVTAGLDARKNHSLGIFRGTDDTFPFRNTHWFDLQEAYGSVMLPIGNGLILKGGKFVTLLGFEAIESPNNLNFSRGYLFTLGTPLTHTGGLIQYKVTDWFTLLVGGVLGWDKLPVLAGLLTVIGFSVNDRIVMYDRLREIRARRPEKGVRLADQINLAVNQTLSRTVLTVATVAMAAATLYLFGGPSLEGSRSWS